MDFLPAGVLRERYEVFGHFYSVRVAPGRVVACRSVLEIVGREKAGGRSAGLSGRKPDAIVLMMNPGSSRPVGAEGERIDRRAIGRLGCALVPAEPDMTQYQVMRLMRGCGWCHVRILNLSDLRCPKSHEFVALYRELEAEHGFDGHSVFSDRRRGELAWKLGEGAPVLRAWGTSPGLDPLIGRCLARLDDRGGVGGLLKEGTTDKFYHPLPPQQAGQRAWVERVVEQWRKGW